MKKSRTSKLRSMAAVLIAAGLLSLPAYQASAASTDAVPTGKVTIGSVTQYLGERAYIPVYLHQPSKGVASYGIEVNFDPSIYEITDILPQYGKLNDDSGSCADSPEGCMQYKADNTAGWVRVIWADASGGDHPITKAQVLFYVGLKNKKPQPSGKSLLEVDTLNEENFLLTDIDGNKLSYEVVKGEIVTTYRPEPPPTTKVEQKTADVPVKVETTKENNRVVTTVAVDNEKLLAQLETQPQKTVTIPVAGNPEVAVAELNGKTVKAMETKDMVLQIQTEKAQYTLPAAQINIDTISKQVGQQVELQDIKVSVEIAESDPIKKSLVMEAASAKGVSVVGVPVDFKVEATYGSKKVEVKQFNQYVERQIAIPDGIDPRQITTGVVVNDDLGLTHVPTKITLKNGTYYAQINSMTNSTYSVIYHPKSFKDVENHWSKEQVNDLGSRLVINGQSEDQFGPDHSVTRAEFTAMITRALGLHSMRAGQPADFTDIGGLGDLEASTRIAASYNLVAGYVDGTFQPKAPITRAEAMVVISRAMQKANLAQVNMDNAASLLSTFADNDSVPSWAAAGIATAVSHNVVQGDEASRLNPSGKLTRAETAALLQRLLIKADLINSK
ncbi:hypothetical protein FHS18_006825 [Paenibacillus phyllosphaerae]|uniref:SLH domain-containing protein n=1 Tax=Paenibacillus phyllosphaerae TaxID=274593 RepID=A0A7W5B5D3_9BACL|nr:S-layer homology domain-containing protein [Paenibacillus phyllosphaerae]MBB3114683.1 hypothetical protein [Paenibacillus phyllosphaerae]